MLEQWRKALDDMDCSAVTAQQEGATAGRYDRLFIGRLQYEPAPSGHPRSDYYANQREVDPIPDPSLLTTADEGFDALSVQEFQTS